MALEASRCSRQRHGAYGRRLQFPDVILYGLAGIYTVTDKLNLVGEINGFHSTRKKAPTGTEDFSTARVGAQIKALGLRWNAAGVFVLSDRAPRTGLSLGITFDWDLFTPVK